MNSLVANYQQKSEKKHKTDKRILFSLLLFTYVISYFTCVFLTHNELKRETNGRKLHKFPCFGPKIEVSNISFMFVCVCRFLLPSKKYVCSKKSKKMK